MKDPLEVQIDFFTIYGCIGTRIYRHGTPVKAWIGATLEKRLNEIIDYLDIEGWEKSKK